MPPSARRTRTDRTNGGDPHVDEPDAESPSGPPSEPTTMTLRLPFMTLSVTRPQQDPAPRPPGQARRGRAATAGGPGPGSGSGERLLFYTGIAALGAAGVIEWPVAAVIAAGTYIAARSRPSPPRPAPRAPGGSRPAGGAPAEVAGTRSQAVTVPDS